MTDPVGDRESDARDTVVLVQDDGTVVGEASKLAAHEAPGHLHLAFSVVLYRADGKTLLQRRALSKYHFPGVWANACCSHPGPGDDLVASAQARVREELGIECSLVDVGSLIYRARCANSGLVEYELDHVLVGMVDSEPIPEPAEVAEVAWADPETVLSEPPQDSAPWLVRVIELAERHRTVRATPS
ncbi:MAG: isopentenyl-diphosphate Delta-isomerase [Acidimicrobiales bacterium]